MSEKPTLEALSLNQEQEDLPVMLNHVRQKGLSLSDHGKEILLRLIRRQNQTAPTQVSGETEDKSKEDDLELVQNLHQELTELLHPVTAASLRASELKGNLTLLSIIFAGVLGGILCLYGLWQSADPTKTKEQLTAPQLTISETQAPAPAPEAPNATASGGQKKSAVKADKSSPKEGQDNSDTNRTPVTTSDLLNIIGGALIGSALYTLVKARPYLRNHTFDLSYQQDYWLRFIIGTLSGTVLALIAKDLPFLQKSDPPNTEIGQVGLVVFAIVGSFSAESVVAILNRIADTLVTMIRGSEKQKYENRSQTAETKAKNDTAKKLQELQGKDPKEIQKEVDKLISGLLK
ncbi:hypothetical protein ACTL6U_05495 [Rhodovibrionaceae bacterium A322]